jgi:hypothetical protein
MITHFFNKKPEELEGLLKENSEVTLKREKLQLEIEKEKDNIREITELRNSHIN